MMTSNMLRHKIETKMSVFAAMFSYVSLMKGNCAISAEGWWKKRGWRGT